MSDSEDEVLDEGMRQRLHRLAAREQLPSLDHDARERVVSTVRARAEHERRMRNRRAWAILGGGVLLAAAAAAVLSWRAVGGHPLEAPLRGATPTSPVAADRRSTNATSTNTTQPDAVARAARSSATGGAAIAPTASRRCTSFAVSPSVTFSSEGDWKRLDLGRALLVLGATDDASVRDATPCSTVVALSHGLIVVHARDLGGGELRVLTDLGNVVVHGTAFSVRRDASGLAVEVVEGTVAVERQGAPPVLVHAEERWTISTGTPSALAPAARAGVRTLLGLDPPIGPTARVSADEPTPRSGAPSASVVSREGPSNAAGPATAIGPDALVRRADAARATGDLETARRLYREAGALGGATAEAAWLALARLELRAGGAAQARRALDERHRRFGEGRLGAEAAWIGVRAARASGDIGRSRREAAVLVSRYPTSPQASAARELLEP